MYVGVSKWLPWTVRIVCTTKEVTWLLRSMLPYILIFSCLLPQYMSQKSFFFVHFSYAVYMFQCWDCIGSEISLCTKDCFKVESSTLLHVELCRHLVSFLCNYFWEIFSYTVCMFWAKNHILFRIFTLVMWCTSFGVHPWL